MVSVVVVVGIGGGGRGVCWVLGGGGWGWGRGGGGQNPEQQEEERITHYSSDLARIDLALACEVREWTVEGTRYDVGHCKLPIMPNCLLFLYTTTLLFFASYCSNIPTIGVYKAACFPNGKQHILNLYHHHLLLRTYCPPVRLVTIAQYNFVLTH